MASQILTVEPRQRNTEIHTKFSLSSIQLLTDSLFTFADTYVNEILERPFHILSPQIDVDLFSKQINYFYNRSCAVTRKFVSK